MRLLPLAATLMLLPSAACGPRGSASTAARSNAKPEVPARRGPASAEGVLPVRRLDGPYASVADYCKARRGAVACEGALPLPRSGLTMKRASPFDRIRLIRLRHHKSAMTRCALTLRTGRGLWVRDLNDCLLTQGHTAGGPNRLALSAVIKRPDGSAWLALTLHLASAPDEPRGSYSEERLRVQVLCGVDATGVPHCAPGQLIGYGLRRMAADQATVEATYRLSLTATVSDRGIHVLGRIPEVGAGARSSLRTSYLRRARAARGRWTFPSLATAAGPTAVPRRSSQTCAAARHPKVRGPLRRLLRRAPKTKLLPIAIWVVIPASQPAPKGSAGDKARLARIAVAQQAVIRLVKQRGVQVTGKLNGVPVIYGRATCAQIVLLTAQRELGRIDLHETAGIDG